MYPRIDPFIFEDAPCCMVLAYTASYRMLIHMCSGNAWLACVVRPCTVLTKVLPVIVANGGVCLHGAILFQRGIDWGIDRGIDQKRPGH